MTIRDDIAARTTTKLADDTDSMLRLAISKAIGDSWTLPNLRGRLRSVRRVGDSFETFYLDDVPLVQLYDPEFSHETRDTSYILKVSRRYRLLAAALKNDLPPEATGK